MKMAKAAIFILLLLSLLYFKTSIWLADAVFYIRLPCSGMYLFIAVLALVVVFIYLLDCKWYKKAKNELMSMLLNNQVAALLVPFPF